MWQLRPSPPGVPWTAGAHQNEVAAWKWSTLERNSLHWMNNFAFSGLNWLTRFLNISVYFLCYIKCDVLVWKSFNFSVSLSADCLWFLSWFCYRYCNSSEQPRIFILFTQWELMVEKWWKFWHPKHAHNWGQTHTKNKCPVQQDVQVLLACLKKDI